MAFPLYPALPLELRRQIIREAVATWIAEHPVAVSSDDRMSALVAKFDPEWKDAIESTLFRDITISIPEDLDDFAAICGPRSGLLKRLTCNFDPWDCDNFPPAPAAGAALIAAISQLFGIMKDWSRPDRNTLITVYICVSVPNCGNRYEFSIDPSDLANLPEVPVIGKLYAQLGLAREVVLSRDTIAGLHAKLPNLQGAQLALPAASGAEFWETIHNTRDSIVATHAQKPRLKKLWLISNDTWDSFWADPMDRDTYIDAARALAPSLTVWKDSLVSLKLDCIIDVPSLLAVAGTTTWPKLDRMDLVGVVESTVSAFRQREDQIVACNDLLRGIAAALPGMPALTKLGSRFRNADTVDFAFSFCMDIGARRGRERQLRQLTECDDPHKSAITTCRPVPSQNAIAKAQGIVLPGDLVTGLQKVVRQQRGMELAVFCCTENEPWDLCFTNAPCRQWDREAEEWDPVLVNGMDHLIYTMGQYWEME